jgi:hypothetical protein
MTDPVVCPECGRPIVRQCTAHARTGHRCHRTAIRGGNVCIMHGGKAPRVRTAALVRLAEAEQAKAAELARTYETYKGPIGNGHVNLGESITRLVARLEGFVDFADGRLRAVTEAGWAAHDPRIAAEVQMFLHATENLRRLLRDTGRLGLDQQAAELAVERQRWMEQEASHVGGLIDRIVARLGHDPDDPAVVAVIQAESRAAAQ